MGIKLRKTNQITPNIVAAVAPTAAGSPKSGTGCWTPPGHSANLTRGSSSLAGSGDLRRGDGGTTLAVSGLPFGPSKSGPSPDGMQSMHKQVVAFEVVATVRFTKSS